MEHFPSSKKNSTFYSFLLLKGRRWINNVVRRIPRSRIYPTTSSTTRTDENESNDINHEAAVVDAPVSKRLYRWCWKTPVNLTEIVEHNHKINNQLRIKLVSDGCSLCGNMSTCTGRNLNANVHYGRWKHRLRTTVCCLLKLDAIREWNVLRINGNHHTPEGNRLLIQQNTVDYKTAIRTVHRLADIIYSRESETFDMVKELFPRKMLDISLFQS